MKIVRQEEFSREGSDCFINSVLIIVEWDRMYTVTGFSRAHGWCDRGVVGYSGKSFDYESDANAYFQHLKYVEGYSEEDNMSWKGHEA